jgi:hypothetical protein
MRCWQLRAQDEERFAESLSRTEDDASDRSFSGEPDESDDRSQEHPYTKQEQVHHWFRIRDLTKATLFQVKSKYTPNKGVASIRSSAYRGRVAGIDDDAQTVIFEVMLNDKTPSHLVSSLHELQQDEYDVLFHPTIQPQIMYQRAVETLDCGALPLCDRYFVNVPFHQCGRGSETIATGWNEYNEARTFRTLDEEETIKTVMQMICGE